MRKLVTFGEILVEIMAEEPGHGFRETLHLSGPYPSGAPAIFADQAAKLGHPCAIIGCVGKDDFGTLTVDRLRHDGVDVSGITKNPEYPTGTAFIRYHVDGGRDFVLNIAHSAAGQISMTEAQRALIQEAGHLHVMGSSLASAAIAEQIIQAIGELKTRGASISFDPNLRGALSAERRQLFRTILAQSDIFLPSANELSSLTHAETEPEAIRELLDMGVTCIVLKRGANGASYYDRTYSVSVPGHRVAEIDPTGAGDCFSATFVACRLQHKTIEASLDYANACGARAVSCKGPMEGTSNFADLDAFIGTQERMA
jgi:sugar/nucleoside kinase (ribokinase family)